MKRIWNIKSGILVFLFLFIIHNSLFIIPTYAQTATPSANIREKLDELKKEIASKAAKLKQEVNQKLQNKAYIGVIKTKSENSITVAAKSGTRIINVNQDTVYQGTTTPTATPTTRKTPAPKKVTVNFNLLKEEDFIVAMGDIDESGVLTAKKVLLLPSNNNSAEQKSHIWGEVVSVSTKTITIKNKNGENKSVTLASDAKFKKGNEDASFGDLKNTNYVIASGFMNDDEMLEADFLHIITQPGTTIKTAEASQSASPSATPKTSTKPIATPKATR